jgi:hypothetical protein
MKEKPSNLFFHPDPTIQHPITKSTLSIELAFIQPIFIHISIRNKKEDFGERS